MSIEQSSKSGANNDHLKTQDYIHMLVSAMKDMNDMNHINHINYIGPKERMKRKKDIRSLVCDIIQKIDQLSLSEQAQIFTATDYYKNNVLMQAILLNDSQLLHIFLERIKKLEPVDQVKIFTATDYYKNNVLMQAIKLNDSKLLRIFLKQIKKLEPVDQVKIFTATDYHKNNFFMQAIKLNDSELLRIFLEQIKKLEPVDQVKIFTATNRYGRDFFMEVIRGKTSYQDISYFFNIIIDQLSLSEQAQIFTDRTNYVSNVLMQAIKLNDSELLHIFLEQIKKLEPVDQVKIFTATDYGENNVLMQAIKLNDSKLLRIFLEQIKKLEPVDQVKIFTATDYDKNNVLMRAIKLNDSELLRIFLEQIKKLEPVDQVKIFTATNCYGRNFFMEAIMGNTSYKDINYFFNIISELNLEDQFKIFAAIDNCKNNVLMHAVLLKDSKVSHIFLEQIRKLAPMDQAKIFTATNRYGQNFFMEAIKRKTNSQDINYFLNIICELNSKDQFKIFAAIDNHGENILMWQMKNHFDTFNNFFNIIIKKLDPSIRAALYQHIRQTIHKNSSKFLLNHFPSYFKSRLEALLRTNFSNYYNNPSIYLIDSLPAYIQLCIYKDNVLSEIKWKIFGISKQDKYQAAQALIDVLDGKKDLSILDEPSIKRALAQGRLNSLYEAVKDDIQYVRFRAEPNKIDYTYRDLITEPLTNNALPPIQARNTKSSMGADLIDFSSQDKENTAAFSQQNNNSVNVTKETTPLYPVLPTHSGQLTDPNKTEKPYFTLKQHDFSIHTDCTYRDLITESSTKNTLPPIQARNTKSSIGADLIDFSSPDEQDNHPDAKPTSAVKDLLNSLPSPPKDAFFQPESQKSQSASSVEPRPQASTGSK